ncbi:carboxylesterase 1-like [Amaranthus tricolor]|uniref:carboxylesterase 1-like n=1 Tax=Amaranthus tricolor TaxID=29722 RepID=UPI00258FE0E5|nr:carboxylesterase 1-like [Amaranthus tricolor]
MQIPNMLVVFSLLIPLILPFNTQAFNQSNKFNFQISTTDPFEFLGFVLNPDGSLTRNRNPTVPPNTTSSLAFSKDIPLNPKKKTWIRVYLPNNTKPRSGKPPIIIFSHGGGFIVGSAAAPDVDSFLSITASQLSMLIVSVEYRLAPEHRLPAAYNHVVEALYWVKEKKDNWVKKFGDFTNCIITGESAGGNIAYTIGVKASHFAKKN